MLIKRRSVLRGLAGMACTPMLLKAISAEAASSGDVIVVVVGMNGGNDGLNTVIPLQSYGQYAALRTSAEGNTQLVFSEAALAATAFDPNPATPAGSATTYAFAPFMTPMRQLYATGKLAVITGIGLPSAELAPLSHFNGWNDWQTGQINVSAAALPNGWLGASFAGASVGPLGATTASTAGTQQATVLNGMPGLAVGNPANFAVSIPNNLPSFLMGDTLQRILDLPTATPTAAFANGVANATLNAMGPMWDYSQLASDYPSSYDYLNQQLKIIAQLIMGGSGISGYVAVQGGYDTHSGQYYTHQSLLTDLSTQLQLFYTYLQGKGLSGNVVIVTVSDFGRTPQVNASVGTDHGAASIAFVLGDPVKGGVYGSYPSLTAFDPNGNLAVNVDFRNMMSDVISAIGGNPTAVLGSTWPKLGFI
jgi:uncharacterized protein (DUF1501 family)